MKTCILKSPRHIRHGKDAGSSAAVLSLMKSGFGREATNEVTVLIQFKSAKESWEYCTAPALHFRHGDAKRTGAA